MIDPAEFLVAGLAALRSVPFRTTVNLDPETFTYSDTTVFRGFPLGGMGSGGISVGSEGGFQSLRINNNWQAPILDPLASFWALAVEGRGARMLRRRKRGDYPGVVPVGRVRFRGRLPELWMDFEDEALTDIGCHVEGWSGLVPHEVKDSTLPVAWFQVRLSNRGAENKRVAFAFSWENVLGLGGTGHTGMAIKNETVVGIPGRLRYTDRTGNVQSPHALDGWSGLRFHTTRKVPERSHRQSVLGEYLLLAQERAGWPVDLVPSWEGARTPSWWEDFAQLRAVSGTAGDVSRPAGVVVQRGELLPGESVELDFVLVWWTADHTTEQDPVERAETGSHAGVRVGHVYERHFPDATALATYVVGEGSRIRARSADLAQFLASTSLPSWLQVSLVNSAVTAITNTVLAGDGVLHTLEGSDWRWFCGGLLGTNDQRLSSHPYTATFHTALDRSELDLFRRLQIAGRTSHGTGNCDLGLGTTEVPYGHPMIVKHVLTETNWPDLNLSLILQCFRHVRTTGDRAWLEEAWPDLLAAYRWCRDICVDGIPVGGTTYDTFEFPGTFLYLATLWLAALDALHALAIERGDDVSARGFQADRALAEARIDRVLWSSEHGFYRTCTGRDTLFLGGMAGDWMARWCGLDGVLPAPRVRDQLRRQHDHLVRGRDGRRGRAAFPHVEVGFDGKIRRRFMLVGLQVFGYAWQIVSYHGASCLYHGLVEEGLETAHVLHERMWERGWPWSGDLYGNAGAIYMTNPVFWALPNALAGASLDRLSGRLSLAPQRLPKAPEDQILPVFFPGFWARLHTRAGVATRLEVERTFGDPIRLTRISVGGREQTGDWQLEAGRAIELSQLTTPI